MSEQLSCLETDLAKQVTVLANTFHYLGWLECRDLMLEARRKIPLPDKAGRGKGRIQNYSQME